MAQVTEIVKLRRKVFTEMARKAFDGTLADKVADILSEVVTEDGPRYRCCVYKERAVLKERIKLALSQSAELDLKTAVGNALRGEIADTQPIVQVMPVACDQCPIDKFFISNACRNCLAHTCITDCPKQAIMIVQNRAYIDKTKCVECGMCKKSCPYGAVIEVSRPCESACGLKAITAGSDRRAVIDYDKCVECGCCKVACPFGAIVDRSFIIQVIAAMQAGKRVHALLAPAFIGQFGARVTPPQLFAALRQIGFGEVSEVSLGADITTYEETKEFMATVPQKRPFMTTSCCPAFADMIDKHLPALREQVSSTVSPMIAAGRAAKLRDPEAVTVFVGPCIAKKGEAKRWAGAIDYVLTFEELACMLVGAGINLALASPEEAPFSQVGSRTASNFARAGGVAESVARELERRGVKEKIKLQSVQGLQQCRMALLLRKAGKTDADLIEGMACEGGCVGGPGVLTHAKVTTKLIESYASQAPYRAAGDNKAATEVVESGGSWHHAHE